MAKGTNMRGLPRAELPHPANLLILTFLKIIVNRNFYRIVTHNAEIQARKSCASLQGHQERQGTES